MSGAKNTEDSDHIARVVAAMPPPTDQQVGRLMAYFPPREHNDSDDATIIAGLAQARTRGQKR